MLLPKMHLGRLILLLIFVVNQPLFPTGDSALLIAQAKTNLASRIKAALKGDDKLADFSIVPLVVEGTVTLYGAVDYQSEQEHAESIVASFDGVKKIVNKVVVLQKEALVGGDEVKLAEKEIGDSSSSTRPTSGASSKEQENEKKNINDKDRGLEDEIKPANLSFSNIPEFHIAKPGQSMREIARQYGLSASDLLQLNGMGVSQQPVAFQKIKLGGTAETRTAEVSNRNQVGEDREKIKSEENGAVVLKVLGKEGNSSPSTASVIVRKENNLDNSTSKSDESEAKTASRNGPVLTQEASMVTRSSSRPLPNAETIERNNWVFHRVANDEKDYEIADHYNISLALLRERNGIRPDASLRKGSLIRIRKID